LRTLRLAGDSLEGLLEQVRREHGDRARIVEANKCRTGGIAGFFARESFEVVIELDDGPDPEPAGAAAAVPAPNGAPTHAPTSVIELAEAVNEMERASAVAGPPPAAAEPAAPVSTETEAFASLLARLARDVDPVEAERLLAAEPVPTATTRAAVPVAAAPSAAAAAAAAPPVPALPVVPELARLGLPAELCGPAGERDLRLVLADRLRTLPPAPPIPHAAGSVLAVVGDADRALALAQDLARELGLEAGDVLLATPEPESRRVPAWLHLDNRDTAGDRRRSWWRRERLTLVAVHSAFGMPTGWARRMLDALEPTLTWGVVDATWKPEDVEHWSDGLGGIDSLAVQNLHATTSPAAILGIDVPVARLDGAAATPSAWSTLLAERLAA